MLALVAALGSLAFTPFTEVYAREATPESVWSSPRFKAVNRQLTTLWASVFAAMAALHLAAGTLDTRQTDLILNWAIPIAVVLYAVKRTAAAAADGTATIAGAVR